MVDDDVVAVEPEELVSRIAHARRTKSNALSLALVKKRGFLIRFHHNRLNVLPSHFVFSNMTPLQLITNWLLGDSNSNIPPYWTFDSKNVVHFKGGAKLRMTRSFMRTVEQHDRELNLWMQSRNSWTYKFIGLLWEGVDSVSKDKYDSARSSGIRVYVKRKRKKTWKLYYNDNVKEKKEPAKRDQPDV